MRSLIALAILLVGCVMHPMSCDDFSAQYVGARYVNSPLGEGFGVDSDPLIREDAFDCTTFVETVLARGDVDRLNKIRYKNGEIDFLNRNHFIESDWMRNNSDLVRNVSADYGQIAVRKVVIDKAAWLRKVHKVKAQAVPEVVLLEYLPYYSVMRGIEVSKTMIVLFIVDNSQMRDKIGTDLAVNHMGVLMPGGVLRHASSSRGVVVDVDFMEYVRERSQNKNNLGIMLLEIKDE